MGRSVLCSGGLVDAIAACGHPPSLRFEEAASVREEGYDGPARARRPSSRRPRLAPEGGPPVGERGLKPSLSSERTSAAPRRVGRVRGRGGAPLGAPGPPHWQRASPTPPPPPSAGGAAGAFAAERALQSVAVPEARQTLAEMVLTIDALALAGPGVPPLPEALKQDALQLAGARTRKRPPALPRARLVHARPVPPVETTTSCCLLRLLSVRAPPPLSPP
eukprot:tig00000194_g14829.t1